MTVATELLDGVRRLRSEAESVWERIQGERSTALVQMMRPQLGRAPAPMRRVLEPVVAASAILALVTLLGLGALSMASFLLVGALILLILKTVFGLELDLEPPLPVD